MIRTIAGYHADGEGHVVAELSCLHGQHVRHQPPWQDRAWARTAEGRAEHLGTAVDCPLCDRAEPPDGLRLDRTAGPFDETTIPAGLLRAHRVAEGRWGRLRVLAGRVGFSLATEPPLELVLEAGQEQAIPPGVAHEVRLDGPMALAVDFLVP